MNGQGTQTGFGLIEVLVTLIIVAVGLLGLAGLQTRAQQTELESYQRTQALILMQDMVGRIRSNWEAARCYETADMNGEGYIGTDNAPTACNGWGTSATRAIAFSDLTAWDGLLEGSAESLGGDDVGAMTGARGCIAYDSALEEFTVSVAWQGEIPTVSPTDSCAEEEYDDDDLTRRVVSTTLTFPELD